MSVFGQSADNSIDYEERPRRERRRYVNVPCPNNLCIHDSDLHDRYPRGRDEWIFCRACECDGPA